MRCKPFPFKSGVFAFMALLALNAYAQQDPDLDALKVADQMPATVEQPSNWRLFVEAGTGVNRARLGGASQHFQRLSLDLQYDNSFAPGWRAVLSDRLDVNWPPQLAGQQHGINTLKEAYLSWQVQTDQILDLGRINARNGVALGYNPTDYFRTSALRSVVSVDPASLKENRQGSIMLRGQKLWSGGSLTALYSPKLADVRNASSFNPDVAATNDQNRWLLALSQQVIDGITPQVLLYKAEKQPVQFGLNLTALLNDSTVMFAEWSGGRSQSNLSQAMRQIGITYPDDSAFRNHSATGLTYTTGNKISLTAELQYNGGGMDQEKWNNLGQTSLQSYVIYRRFLQGVQEAPAKRSVFVYASWQDALINHLDLAAMSRHDLADSSRMSWLEARYHVKHSEFALQWQRNSGTALSNYGAAPQMQSWQLLARYYF
ncbi:hypothetical protein ACO0LD_02860 [Undibacterium sp. Ji83W]|uniref:hypothetical protein n=1 Tax=Undibacterium sp. Ji83W TaxID=3413043 RepID=UPI003BF080E5